MRKFVSPKGNEVYFGHSNPFENAKYQLEQVNDLKDQNDKIEQMLNNMGIEICQPCKQCHRQFRHHECHCGDICQKCENDNEAKAIKRNESIIYYGGILQQNENKSLTYSPYRSNKTINEKVNFFKFCWAWFMVKVWLK